MFSKKIKSDFSILIFSDVALSSNVRECLKSPSFDARQWEEEELLLMLQTMFVELEILQKFSISLSTLRNFLYEVYNNYNEVPFHNFRHCFCVAQMVSSTLNLSYDLSFNHSSLKLLPFQMKHPLAFKIHFTVTIKLYGL